MKEPPKTVTLNLNEPLRESPRRATSLALELATSYKLDFLAELAGAANTSRGEIISMLIGEAPEDAEELERRILAHRKKAVGDMVPAQADQPRGDDENVVEMPLRPPGRPSRRNVS
jgi:hypothetical protein